MAIAVIGLMIATSNAHAGKRKHKGGGQKYSTNSKIVKRNKGNKNTRNKPTASRKDITIEVKPSAKGSRRSLSTFEEMW